MTQSRPYAKPRGQKLRRVLLPVGMVLPSVAFLVIFMGLPGLVLVGYSLLTQASNGDIGLPITFHNYITLFTDATNRSVLWRTILISLYTTVIAIFMAYPLAMSIAYGKAWMSRITIVIVMVPLVVNVIVRTYGWELVLGNGKSGVANYVLGLVGIPPFLHLMNTRWAVVITSVHVFLPLLVLPLAASLSRIRPNLVEAARMLGAPLWRAFLSVTLPLSLPGLVAGSTIVFVLTSASYITPQMVGGTDGLMLGVVLEQEINAVYNWPMGGAIGALMITIALVANIGANMALPRFFSRQA